MLKLGLGDGGVYIAARGGGEFGGAGGKGAIPEKSRGGHSVGSGKSKHVKSCA